MSESMKLHHIGYGTKNIDATIEDFKSIGYSVSRRTYDEIQNVHAVVLTKHNELMIELIESLNDSNPAFKFIHGATQLYHIGYLTSNFDAEIVNFRNNGYIPTTRIIPAVAFDNRRLIFFFKPSVGLIELLEDSDEHQK